MLSSKRKTIFSKSEPPTLEIGLTATYPVAIEEPGAIAVQAKQLYEIVKALNTDELTLEASENHWITVNQAKVNLD